MCLDLLAFALAMGVKEDLVVRNAAGLLEGLEAYFFSCILFWTQKAVSPFIYSSAALKVLSAHINIASSESSASCILKQLSISAWYTHEVLKQPGMGFSQELACSRLLRLNNDLLGALACAWCLISTKYAL